MMSPCQGSGDLGHVRGHTRAGSGGAVDVSAYDRSPPGGGAAPQASDSGRAWEKQGNAAFRNAIARAERSAEHRNHGYRQYDDAGGGKGAFERYQLRMGALVEAGWMDSLGRWTEKAAAFGVKTDVDFLERPEAQEAAMTDVLHDYERQLSAKSLDQYIGKEYVGLDGSKVVVTRAGLIAAGHREGMGPPRITYDAVLADKSHRPNWFAGETSALRREFAISLACPTLLLSKRGKVSHRFQRLCIASVVSQGIYMPAANCDSEIGLKGIPLVFHVAETEAERRFAFEQFVRYAKGEKPAVWHAAVEKNQVILAEADLNNDGVPERFVMARIFLWCGSAGCLTLILQEKHGKWQLIDQGTFADESAMVLNEVRYGYHRVYTGEDVLTFRDGKIVEVIGRRE